MLTAPTRAHACNGGTSIASCAITSALNASTAHRAMASAIAKLSETPLASARAKPSAILNSPCPRGPGEERASARHKLRAVSMSPCLTQRASGSSKTLAPEPMPTTALSRHGGAPSSRSVSTSACACGPRHTATTSGDARSYARTCRGSAPAESSILAAERRSAVVSGPSRSYDWKPPPHTTSSGLLPLAFVALIAMSVALSKTSMILTLPQTGMHMFSAGQKKQSVRKRRTPER